MKKLYASWKRSLKRYWQLYILLMKQKTMNCAKDARKI